MSGILAGWDVYHTTSEEINSLNPIHTVEHSSFEENEIFRPRQLWCYKSKGSFCSAPVVSGERVIAGDKEGTLNCLSTVDGRKIWSRSFSGYLAATPVIDENNIYITPSSREVLYFQKGGGFLQAASSITSAIQEKGAVRCLDLEYGRRRWKRRLPRPVHCSPVLAGDRLLVGCLDYKIYCLERATGSILWEFKSDGPVDYSPSIYKGKVIVGSRSGSVFCLSLEDGRKYWEFRVGKQVFSSPVSADGMVYIGASNGELHALSIKNGKPVWRIGLEEMPVDSPIIIGEFVFIASTAGKIYCLHRKKGAERWSQKLPGRIVSPPRVMAGGILASTDQGIIYYLASEDGEVHWKYNLFSHAAGWLTPAGGRIYVTSTDRKVYCLGGKVFIK